MTAMMKSTEARDLIIIDPMLVSKDEDWGEDGALFDWGTGKINSPVFSEYIWADLCTYGLEGLCVRFKRGLGKQAFKDEIIELLDNIENDNEISQEFQYLPGSVNGNENTSGYTGVFYLDEVMKYNPDFKIPEDDCILIKDYQGTIEVDTANNYILGFSGKYKQNSFAVI